MTGPTVVTCAHCQGLTFTLGTCGCVSRGDRFLVEADQRAERKPYRDCELCRGDGTVANACHHCGQRGVRRAQLVLTVVNADTGAVASASLTPGGVEPRPASRGGWEIALAPVVRQLADAVGATALTVS
ncbi:hypothetical protein [Micromonospora zhanjiangensis]|uniref:Uncharacterized protein n=1 Tax=Micromonospora zhanjiangensis TaxID=1522057 RepID=A0ABV8KM04_9ACTN